jgi:hypothetical protein
MIVMATIGASVLVHAGDGVVGGSPARIASTNGIKAAAIGFTNFITRSGDKLMDGSRELRFISINSPGLHVCPGSAMRTDPWEMQDALQSIAQMGGTVTRVYVFRVRGPGRQDQAHYYGDGNYDEDLFVDFDKMLQLAEKNGIRIIIPFLDQNEFGGSYTDFAKINGGGDFFTNPVVIERFKGFIQHILNRVNTVTGEKYKDCKAILAWETGNEISAAPDNWSRMISAFIKSMDPNHLVADGRLFNGRTPSAAAVDDPNMDIMDSHIYQGEGDLVGFVRSCRDATKDKKVFIAGEFGYRVNQYNGLDTFLDTVISSGISGAMIWSQRFHRKDGGFHFHTEDGTYIYHWPGINANEVNVLTTLRNSAYKIRGLPVPPRPVPEPPVMLSCSNVMAIAWRGSVGAESYDVERAISPSGPWTTAGTNILENTDPYRPFIDRSIRAWGQSYYYRMKARNAAGVSAPSKVVGPVLAEEEIVDEMKDFSWMYAHTTNLACGKGDGSHFRGDPFTLSRTESTNASFVYRTTSAMNNFSVRAFFWPPEPVVDVTFSTSADGATYAGFKPAISNFGGDWKELEYTGVNLPSGTRYLKIGLMGTSSNYWNPQIGRVHIGCQRAP